ncbi:NHL repeat-containing protein [Tanacetum coccineum]
MMKFESGYNVETVFDGSKLGIEPHALEVLPNGELLILDSANSNLYKISSSLSLYSKPKLVAGSADGYFGHVVGRLKKAKMNHPKGLTVDDKGNIYVADTDNMAIRKINDTDRGNQAIREIQLPFDDCAYQYGSGFPLGIAFWLAAGYMVTMLALCRRRVGSMISNGVDETQTTMKPSIAPIPPYQKSMRPPLIPSENEPEKLEEGFLASLGKLMSDATTSFSEILRNIFPSFKKQQLNYNYPNQQPFLQDYKYSSNPWPVQDSYVIPDSNEPPPSIKT